MGAPCVGQLPLAVLLVPDFDSMIRGSCHNAISIEIELGDRDEIAMSSFKVCEQARHPGRAAIDSSN
jgi:hypothetical protein